MTDISTIKSPDTLTLASATRPSLSVYDGQTRLGYLVRRDSNRRQCRNRSERAGHVEPVRRSDLVAA